ncbi:MAG: VCBS repeat-containing protein [Bacteroidetes bacterium]|nr:VCBS repeat-containing protein [Bacteroidota bacterium]
MNVGIIPTSVSVSDFNSDGKQDLAITKNGSATVAIRLEMGPVDLVQEQMNVETNPWSVAIADFNGDGKQDLAVANNGSASVSIRLGDGLGSFSGTNKC